MTKVEGTVQYIHKYNTYTYKPLLFCDPLGYYFIFVFVFFFAAEQKYLKIWVSRKKGKEQAMNKWDREVRIVLGTFNAVFISLKNTICLGYTYNRKLGLKTSPISANRRDFIDTQEFG